MSCVQTEMCATLEALALAGNKPKSIHTHMYHVQFNLSISLSVENKWYRIANFLCIATCSIYQSIVDTIHTHVFRIF